MQESQLIDIRCPFKKVAKQNGPQYVCNAICVKVHPGSSGEAYCIRCKKSFDFETQEQMNVIRKVRAKSVK